MLGTDFVQADFVIFKIMKNFSDIKSFKNRDHDKLKIPKKLKTILNKETDKTIQVPEYISKHSVYIKSLQPPFIVVYDFETMIVETDDHLKLGKLSKNKDDSFTVETSQYMLKEFGLVVFYLEGIINIFVILGKIFQIVLLKREMKL